MTNRCYLCNEEEELVNHLFIHYKKIQSLWVLMLNTFGFKRVKATQ